MIVQLNYEIATYRVVIHTPEEAFSVLYPSAIMFRSDPENKNMVFDTVTEIINRVPV